MSGVAAVVGTIVCILLLGVVSGLIVFGILDKNKEEGSKGIFKMVQASTAVPVYIEVAARGAEVVFGILLAIFAGIGLQNGGRGLCVFAIVVAVLVVLYAAVPTWLARLLILLKNGDHPELFTKIDLFRRKQLGAIVFFAVDTVLALLVLVAAGGTFAEGAIPAGAFAVIVFTVKLAMVFLGFAIFMYRDVDEKQAQRGQAPVEQTPTDVEGGSASAGAGPALSVPPAAVEAPASTAATMRIAEFDYTADRDDELTFKEGDRIQVKAERSDGWAKGVLVDSEADPKPEGMFPLNYTKEES